MASVNKVILVGNLGKDPEVRFMPKGGMCVTCTKKLHFCNDLPFSTMPALITLDNGVTIVKCTEHVRANATR